ncbi:MAG: dynamin family protein [Chloroflexota bacterium]
MAVSVKQKQPVARETLQFARDVVKLGIDATAAYQRPDLEARIQQSLDRLARPDTIVCITGEFKKGKSSLINALLGEQTCPVDDDLATSAITIVRDGDAWSVQVRRHEGEESVTEAIDRDDIDTFVTERGNPENRRRVEFVEIQCPNRFLGHGVTLVDTPGSGTLASGYGSATLAFLQSADALIFVTDASQEFSAPEIEYLRASMERCSTLLIAMSKIDLYPEWRRILDINRQHLAEAGIEATIIPVSATLRDHALATRDRTLNEESGVPELLEAIRSHVLDQASRRAALSALSATRAAVEQLCAGYNAEIEVLEDPEHAAEMMERLEDARSRMSHLRSAGSRWSTLLNDGFTTLTSSVDYQFRSTMRSILRNYEEEIEEHDPAASWDDLTQRLQEDIARAVEEAFNSIDDQVGEIRDSIIEFLRDETSGELDIQRGLTLDARDLWTDRELETSTATQKIFKGLNAMRGSYMGLLMVGMLGNFVGLAMVGPVLVGAGLLFGGRQFLEERKRDITKRRQQARTFVRQYVDDVQFEAGARIRDTTRDFQRTLRDYFTDRITELGETYNTTIQSTQQSLKADQDARAKRLADLKTRVEKLSELERRIELAEQQL